MRQRTFETQIADDGLLDEIIEKTQRVGGPAPHDGGDDEDDVPPEVVIQFVITGLDQDESASEPEPAPKSPGWLWFAIAAALGVSS